MKFAKAVICLAFIGLAAGLTNAGQIDTKLREKLLSDHDRSRFYRVIAVMADQADIGEIDRLLLIRKASLVDRHHQVITALQEIANQTQPPVSSYIRYWESAGDIRSAKYLWIANMVAFEGKANAIWAIASLNSIDKIYLDIEISTIQPIAESKPSPPGRIIAGRESGLDRIHAPETWALGYTGYGRIVGNLDTGVDGYHPALSSRFRGDVNGDGNCNESWFDPYTTHWTYPIDSGTHGTHTMGTICGRTAAGDTIGVAIDAKWIAAACIDRGGGISRTVSDALLAIQWIADPDENPITADNPDACGNSWGIPDDNGYEDCNQTFWIAIDNCEAAGTVMVFAAGNEGASGLRSPSDRATTYGNCFSIGAVNGYDPNLEIASFSARGPSECARGDLAIKPEVTAPGVNVRSSIRGGGYQVFSGTSMACPHVAGAVAVIRQANPNLDANSIKHILMQTASDLGESGEDNAYGHGIINLYAAVTAAMNFGGADGYVRDASSLAPIPGKIKVAGAPIQLFANNEGYYYVGLKADTTYTLEASYYGYLTARQSAAIALSDTVQIDFNLTAAPLAIVQGTIYSNVGNAISGAEVTILDSPIPSDTTDLTGFYQFAEVPSGATYFIEVSAENYTKGFDSISVQAGIINPIDIRLWPVESFENSEGGFTGGDVWQWGIPTSGPNGAYSGTNCWATILNGDYPNSAQDTLFADTVFVESQDSRLQFYHWYQFEEFFDGGNLIISTDAGLSWDLVTPSGGYPDAEIIGLNHQPGYSNVSNGWELVSVNLAAYYNHNIIFGWRIGSDGSVTKSGWYIDNVSFTGCIPPPPSVLTFSPSSYAVIMNPGTIETRDLFISNLGVGPLNYRISGNPLNLRPTRPNENSRPIGYLGPDKDKSEADSTPYFAPITCGHGGPDSFGYIWKDSDEPHGPLYNWIDITSIGTSLSLGDDDYAGPIPLNFAFPFYDSSYSSLYIGSNGFISFDAGYSSTANTGFPNSNDPNNLIALWWDDLNPASDGKVYYYQDPEYNRFILSFIEIPNYQAYYGTGSLTFQAILYSTGKIVLQYQYMDPGEDPDSLHGATIGIENLTGTDGLQVVYNANYILNELAIAISRNWLNVLPKQGTIGPSGIDTATVILDANYLDGGIYSGNINIQSNDTANSNINIPVTLSAGNGGTPIIDFDDADLSDSISADSIDIKYLTVYNRGNGILAVEFGTYGEWIQINGGPHYIAPLDSLVLPIQINSSGFDPGTYSGIINFVCNDPELPEGNLELELFIFAPRISIALEVLADTLYTNQNSIKAVIINNNGPGKLNYSIDFTEDYGAPRSMPTDNFQSNGASELATAWPLYLMEPQPRNTAATDIGGPDSFGYRWFDSNDPAGPAYNWIDINSIGNRLMIYYDDQNVGPIAIGFPFMYYGVCYDSLRFCSNGWLSFTSLSTAYNNTTLPNSAAPSNLLAAFWDDLVFYGDSRAYFYSNHIDSAIATWQNVYHVGGGGPYTFQVILIKSGKIIFQYGEIGIPDSLATIGIQNYSGSSGLLASYNSRYATDNLAAVFWPGWLTFNPRLGEIPPLLQDTVLVNFDSYLLNSGTHSGLVMIQSNDPLSPGLTIPVSLVVMPEINALLSLSDSVFWDTLPEGSAKSYSLYINNLGSGLLNYHLNSNQEWLVVDYSGGVLIPAAADTIGILVNTIGLEVGDHLGNLSLMSNDPLNPIREIEFFLAINTPECDFMAGDINGDRLVVGSDIVYGVRYFKGLGSVPPDSCRGDSLSEWVYVSGDVNGDCEFRGSDITYLVGYFKGIVSTLGICQRFVILAPLRPSIELYNTQK